MELSQIIFLKNISPIEILDNPSNRTKEAVLRLIKDRWFDEKVSTLRKQLNLPDQGADIRLLKGKNLLDTSTVPSFLSLFLSIFPKQVVERYGLAEDFMVNMLLLEYFNAFIALEYFKGFIESDFEYIPTKALIAYKLHSYKNEVGAIIIPYQNSKQKLKEWIDINWEKIECEISTHLLENTGISDLTKNTLLGDEIDKLLKIDKTYQKVSETLTDKYPDDKRLTDPDQVRIIHKRYFKDLVGFSSKFPTEQ